MQEESPYDKKGVLLSFIVKIAKATKNEIIWRFSPTPIMRGFSMARMASEIMTGLWAEIFVMDREYKKVVVKKQYQYKTYLIKRNIQHRRFINDYSRTDYEPSVRTART